MRFEHERPIHPTKHAHRPLVRSHSRCSSTRRAGAPSCPSSAGRRTRCRPGTCLEREGGERARLSCGARARVSTSESARALRARARLTQRAVQPAVDRDVGRIAPALVADTRLHRRTRAHARALAVAAAVVQVRAAKHARGRVHRGEHGAEGSGTPHRTPHRAGAPSSGLGSGTRKRPAHPRRVFVSIFETILMSVDAMKAQLAASCRARAGSSLPPVAGRRRRPLATARARARPRAIRSAEAGGVASARTSAYTRWPRRECYWSFGPAKPPDVETRKERSATTPLGAMTPTVTRRERGRSGGGGGASGSRCRR